MRCPTCSKFVSFEDGDTEIDGEDFDAESLEISCTLRIVDLCAECGDELQEANFEISESLDEAVWLQHVENRHEDGRDDCDRAGLEAKWDDPEREGYTQTTDRNGKRIRSARYMRTFKGASVNYTIICGTCCDEVYAGDLSDKVPASGMESLV